MSGRVELLMPKRFFVALCIMGLFAILSSTMSKSPVLNPFVVSLGTPAYLLGFVAAASTIPGILVSLPAGSISDRVGRGEVIFFAGFIFAAARMYKCEVCGFEADRDLNAALNLAFVAASWAETQNACKRGEVHAPAGQVLPHEAGTEHHSAALNG